MRPFSHVLKVIWLGGFFFGLMLLSPLLYAAESNLSQSDQELLDRIQRSAFQYFLRESNPQTGLVRDDADNRGRGESSPRASVAASGFGLTALGIGVERGWVERGDARARTLAALRFFESTAQQEHGFFYHFLDPKRGTRSGKSELSPIDTALFLAGATFAAEYFQDSQIRELVDKISARIDWSWMLDGSSTLAMSWTPDHGFSRSHWDHFDESLLMYAFAIGSLDHSIPESSWAAIRRPVGSYKEMRVLQMPPLFTHQFPHLWLDLRGKHDAYADYFENSVTVSKIHRQFAIDRQAQFKSYGPDSWGLTASNGPFGYKAYGAPPGWAVHDGTIAPTACVTSIIFTPEESLRCARYLYETHGDKLWGNYGFSDAFNLDRDWFDDRVIGIDQGAMLIAIENFRTGMVWRSINQSTVIASGLKNMGFQSGTKTLDWPDPPEYRIPYLRGGVRIDGYMSDWPNRQPLLLGAANLENGSVDNDQDLSARIWFGWNEEGLFFIAQIKDNSVIQKRSGPHLWMDDAFEIFVDPGADGLDWDKNTDFQIGFRATSGENDVVAWSWFGTGEDPIKNRGVLARGYSDSAGYLVEGMIRWSYLGWEPRANRILFLTPAVHDIDQDRSQAKISWFFRQEEMEKHFALGKIILENNPDRHLIDIADQGEGKS